jgi:hypothetical protein
VRLAELIDAGLIGRAEDIGGREVLSIQQLRDIRRDVTGQCTLLAPVSRIGHSAAVEAMIGQTEEAGLAPIVSTPSGDPSAVQVELTAAGVAQHRTLRSAIDQVADELCAGIPEHDLTAARRVLAEVSRRRPRLDAAADRHDLRGARPMSSAAQPTVPSRRPTAPPPGRGSPSRRSWCGLCSSKPSRPGGSSPETTGRATSAAPAPGSYASRRSSAASSRSSVCVTVPAAVWFGLMLVAMGVGLFVQHGLDTAAADGEDRLWIHVPLGVALVALMMRLNMLARGIGGPA